MKRGENGLDSGGEQQAASRFADDRFYQSLAAQQRRRILAYLLEQGESTVSELADVLCGWEASEPVVGQEEHRTVRVALEHNHLPALDRSGLVAYDREKGRVALGDLDEEVRELVRRSVERD